MFTSAPTVRYKAQALKADIVSEIERAPNLAISAMCSHLYIILTEQELNPILP